MTYLLVALLTLSTGQVHAYTLDHGLTYEDCQQAVTHGINYGGPVDRIFQTATLTCEVEVHPAE